MATPLTAQQAQEEYRRRKLRVATDFFIEQLHVAISPGDTHHAELLVDALSAVEVVSPDRCDHVDDDGKSDCDREYGHPPFVVRTDLSKREPVPDPDAPSGFLVKYGTKEDRSAGGHYTFEYDDDRRPDGSHPWDY